MTERDTLMFENVHDNISNTFQRLHKNNGTSATYLNRTNFTDAMKILGNMFIFNIDKRLEAEIVLRYDTCTIIFNIKQDEGED